MAVVSALMVLFIFALCALLYFWLRRRRYTRERFAFAALAAFLTLSMAVIASLSASITIWDIIRLAIGVFTTETVQVSPPTVSDHLLMICVVALFGVFASSLFRRWGGEGQLSEESYSKRFEAQSMRNEALTEALRIVRRQPPILGRQAEQVGRMSPAAPGVMDIGAWNEQARTLVQICYGYLYFDPNDGWHESLSAWIGRNRDTGRSAVLLICREWPDAAEARERLARLEPLVEDLRESDITIAAEGIPGEPIDDVNGIRIRTVTRDDLLDRVQDFSDYFSELRRRVTIDCLPDSEITLQDTYVRSAGAAGESEVADVHQYLLDWLNETSYRQIALLGEYGQGKSSLALMLAHELASQFKPGDRVPILIELRGMSPRSLRPQELLAIWASRYGYRPDAIMALVQSGRALLILEGFDELELIGAKQARIEHFKTLWRLCFPGGKLLITGRPNFFLDDEEMKSSLSITESTATGPYSEAVRLAPFDVHRIKTALRCIPTEHSQEILDLAKKNPRFLEIASRPSLLYIVGQLWESLRSHRVNMSSAHVISQFISFSYARQAEKSRQSGRFMILNSAERAFFMRGVAAYMAAVSFSNQISREQLIDVVAGLLDSIPDTVSARANAALDEPSTPLRKRLADREDAADNVRADVSACGILATDISRSNSLRFAHKSFMECLAAGVVADLLVEEGEARVEASSIHATTKVCSSDILRSVESTSFLAEIIAGRVDSSAEDDSGTASDLYQAIVVRHVSLPSRLVGLANCWLAGWGRVAILGMLATILAAFLTVNLMLIWNLDTERIYSFVWICGVLIAFSVLFTPPYVNITMRPTFANLILWRRCCWVLSLDTRTVISDRAIKGLASPLIYRSGSDDFMRLDLSEPVRSDEGG